MKHPFRVSSIHGSGSSKYDHPDRSWETLITWSGAHLAHLWNLRYLGPWGLGMAQALRRILGPFYHSSRDIHLLRAGDVVRVRYSDTWNS